MLVQVLVVVTMMMMMISTGPGLNSSAGKRGRGWPEDGVGGVSSSMRFKSTVDLAVKELQVQKASR